MLKSIEIIYIIFIEFQYFVHILILESTQWVILLKLESWRRRIYETIH